LHASWIAAQPFASHCFESAAVYGLLEWKGQWRPTKRYALAGGAALRPRTRVGGHLLIGRFTLGSEVGYGIRLRDGTFHIGLTGILNFHSDDLVINGVLVTPNATRAKVEAGVLIKSPSGPFVRAAIAYDGIGESEYSSVTGKVWVNVPFQ
jgi:hypothetical protein